MVEQPLEGEQTRPEIRRSERVTHGIEIKHDRLSRRNLLRRICGGGAIVCIGLGSTRAAGASKMPKTTVSYQPSSRGAARCATCNFYQTPYSCSYVDGPISPSGWCVLYRRAGHAAN